MTKTEIETDYLVIGSGAMGMAFADVILSESDKQVLIVDMHHKPGGHWNDAYSFVTLHQPSSYYGVSSKELSKGRIDQTGLNKGLNDLATGPEVLSYFDEVMRHHFLPSGRIQYFPMCEYNWDGTFTSMLSGETVTVKVREKTVDATYLKTQVPSTHKPNFEIADGLPFVPLNELPKLKRRHSGYLVVGGGKTGIDAVLWMLEHSIPADDIHWVMSRDAWLMDRGNTQPTEEFFDQTMGAQAAQFEAIAQSTSVEDMFDRLEAAGVFLRIDKNVRPKMFHGATVSQAELTELRKIKNIIRMGRIQRIEPDKIVFEQGEMASDPDWLYVDCSARAVGNMEEAPVFQGDQIKLQTVRTVQPVFSAAVIAYVDLNYPDEAEKNRLCTVVPLPNHDTDWLRMTAAFMTNQFNWSQDKTLRAWIGNNRLDGYSHLARNVDKEDTAKTAVLQRLRDNSMPAMMKLQQYIAELPA
ncbi:MAG: NAD(P)/FAD-dependent oxidoreductase [Henriciella sp.]|nr:NAD(P)/FAD-dependent oxidoreductase [Henriciella sp.]